jgi:hypothetical protein
MSRPFRLSRRHFLRGAGGVAVALPFLGAMAGTARAVEFPKRFVVFFTGLGTVKSSWVPTGTEKEFTLSPILSPLAAFQEQLLVLEGLDMESAHHGPGDPHQLGIAQALTATELMAGDLFKYACSAQTVGWGGGISLDQFLAQQIGATTKFGSLELGVQVQHSNVSSRISYLGASQPVPPDDDPYGAFSRIFGDLSDDPESLARLRSHRHHVLDAVQQDYKALNAKLGSADREKLSNHLDAIESIEKRLDSPGLLGGACALPTVGAPTDIYANDNYPAIGKLQLDLLAMALACDLTRVGSIQWASTQAGKMFTWLGLNDTHHNLSHSSNSNADAQAKLTSIGKWHAEQLAYFMGKLASIPEGDGTLLDNTLILWCTDISAGNSHSRRDMPYLLAGGAGGYLEMGRYLQYAGTPHTHLLISIANAMGVNIQSFGNPEYGTGPLPRLAAQSYGVPFVHWQP